MVDRKVQIGAGAAGAGSVDRHKVVIIGSGFGGMNAAKMFRRTDFDVTLIACTNHHLFQPLLYQVATGILSAGEVAVPTRVVLRRQRNARVLLGDVTDIDLASRRVLSTLLGRTYSTPYDSLIVAAGAGQSYFGNDHFTEFAPGMKSIDDALELRARILGALEQAERSSDPDRVRALLTFTVIGAGPTGVEMAGQIAELAHHTFRGSFRSIDSTAARVILLDAASAVLPSMGPKLGKKAQGRLEKIGVDIQLGAKVVDIDSEGLTVEDPDATVRRIESICKVWSAGVSASPLGKIIAAQSGAETDNAGRVKVLPDLTIPGHPNVFVVGDMASIAGVPGLAQAAIQGGRYAAGRVMDTVSGSGSEQRQPFRYSDRGSMATISRFSAVAKIGPLEFGGATAWIAWLALHLAYLIGFKTKISTVLSWTISFLSAGRGQLASTEQQAYARTRINKLQKAADSSAA
ncbi:NAD(P)/FAD-dependent oxidoreductase [[Mycobacterium] wendilense]|uniref:NADH:ubiquinone reductase (non-electrogenic) n=1 Tax=[Mycobacterium] wendilense TaxID=3064284 RepID=A0ABM9MIC4_9MYCO|nr:NAD(P)/FAD-dependent oxidoreductase [Mycolicibacterium sp. MU0050]CAJ1585899.1 NAD(P)/FAD-dependent oxidoreductase [Mycolicibacterium sp. MU0050]